MQSAGEPGASAPQEPSKEKKDDYVENQDDDIDEDDGPWIDVSQLDFNQLEEELSQVLDSFDGDVFVVFDMSDDDIE